MKKTKQQRKYMKNKNQEVYDDLKFRRDLLAVALILILMLSYLTTYSFGIKVGLSSEREKCKVIIEEVKNERR